MTNSTFDGVALVTEPLTLGVLDCGDDFTAAGHVILGTAIECPEHCTTWEAVGTFAAEVLHTHRAMNITIA